MQHFTLKVKLNVIALNLLAVVLLLLLLLLRFFSLSHLSSHCLKHAVNKSVAANYKPLKLFFKAS